MEDQRWKVALGDYSYARDIKSRISALHDLPVDFVDVRPITRAFAPMVREQRFDISEMALVTFLQARAYDKPLVLLPVTVTARFQEASLMCRRDDVTIRDPSDLVGKRIGVRAYSQTTGMWVRGVLEDDYDIPAHRIRWVTFEDAHVGEYVDPLHVERAAPEQEMLAMLFASEIDAVILGTEGSDVSPLRTVFPNPATAADRFNTKHGFMPVNHLIAARRSLVETNRDEVMQLLQACQTSLAESGLGASLMFGCNALEPIVKLALRYAAAQGLLSRHMTVEDVWAGLPAEILSLGSVLSEDAKTV